MKQSEAIKAIYYRPKPVKPKRKAEKIPKK